MVAAAWCVVAVGAAMASDGEDARVRAIIVGSQHLGAHGLGYNSDSMQEMSRKLGPNDIPTLIRLLNDKELSVGAEFGLASQCGAAIDPVRRAAAEKEADFLSSEEVMEMIVKNSACPAQTKQEAESAKTELAEMWEADNKKRAEELAKERANDQRIQGNAMKIMDPNRRGELTMEERKEAFERSVKAAGLENPKTPEQKALVERMYRTMVLGKSDNKKTPN